MSREVFMKAEPEFIPAKQLQPWQMGRDIHNNLYLMLPNHDIVIVNLCCEHDIRINRSSEMAVQPQPPGTSFTFKSEV